MKLGFGKQSDTEDSDADDPMSAVDDDEFEASPFFGDDLDTATEMGRDADVDADVNADPDADANADADDADGADSGDPDLLTVAPKARKIIYVGKHSPVEESLEDEMAEKMPKEKIKEYTILGVTVGVGAIIAIVLGGLGWNGTINTTMGPMGPINWIMVGAMIAIGPYGFWKSAQVDRVKKLEERLSDFLRDLSESSRSGMTLPDAIKSSAKGEYGELTTEIQKMSIQISWGITATDALQLFADRVKTPLVERSVTLIIEASNAGGRVSSVLSAAANDTKEIQLLQQERAVQMGMYVMVIMVSFMVFLVVILIVYSSFAPQMEELQASMKEAQEDNPDAAGAVGGMGSGDVDFLEIRRIYILAGLIQGGGDGLVAGVMGTGKLINGMKYSFLMIVIVFVMFTFAL